jgi:hypothetical protein
MQRNIFTTTSERLNHMHNSLIERRCETRENMDLMLNNLDYICYLNRLVALWQHHEGNYIKPFEERFNGDTLSYIIVFLEGEMISREGITHLHINNLRELHGYTQTENYPNNQNETKYAYALFDHAMRQDNIMYNINPNNFIN